MLSDLNICCLFPFKIFDVSIIGKILAKYRSRALLVFSPIKLTIFFLPKSQLYISSTDFRTDPLLTRGRHCVDIDRSYFDSGFFKSPLKEKLRGTDCSSSSSKCCRSKAIFLSVSKLMTNVIYIQSNA